MKSQKSFTIIELLVVIAIIGLLSSITVFSVQGSKERARIGKSLALAGNIHRSMGAYAVAAYDFNDGTASDISGSNNNGTINGATPVAGMTDLGNAFSFNGTNNYIDVGNGASFNSITDAITIEGWFYLAIDPNVDAGNNYRQMVGRPGYNPWGLLLEENRAISGSVYIGGARQKTDTTTYFMPVGKWVHVAYTYLGSTGKAIIYADGTLSIEQTRATGIFNTSVSSVRISTIQGFYGWPGLIDEVRIYNQALSLSEIQKHYAEGLERHQVVKK